MTSPETIPPGHTRPLILQHWTPRAIGYLALALIGLVGTWTFNISAILHRRNFAADWINSGPSVSSLTVDLLIVAVAGSVLIVVESRRLGLKGAWIYLVLAAITAFAFVFPLFLAMRERALTATRGSTPIPR